MSRNHFEQVVDSMIIELKPIMTNYSQDDLRILVASFMKGYQKLYKHKYYNPSAFDEKLIRISKIKHNILSEYYSV